MSFVAAVHFAALLIDACVTMSIALAAARAFFAIAGGRPIEAARLSVADGVVRALGFGVAATVLRAIVIHSWLDIATLAIIYIIRTIVKRLFAWESAALHRTVVAMRGATVGGS